MLTEPVLPVQPMGILGLLPLHNTLPIQGTGRTLCFQKPLAEHTPEPIRLQQDFLKHKGGPAGRMQK
jgi:hypothetical protein